MVIKCDYELRTCSKKFVWGPVPVISDFAASTPVSRSKEERGRVKRKRKSRWEPVDEDKNGDVANEKGKEIVLFPGEIVLSNGLKVTLPPALTGRHASGNPEIVKLHTDLADVDRLIRSGAEDTRPEHERSPSPPPIYDSQGVRLNTREVRMKEKLTKQRNAIIEELLKKDETFKPPSDYRPEKKVRKIFIPYKEYPDANFIGLIIGPRGNTQKRMQEETNTRIAIRGKGSVKEGAARAQKYSSSEDEDLHVLIVGDRQEDVDKAAEMIEKLLIPVDEDLNEHKKAQLRELALINGTLKDEQHCYLCGETGHMQLDCPKKQIEVYKLPDAIQEKVEQQYARDLAKLNPDEARKNDEEYKNFLESLGGADPRAPGANGKHAGIGYGNKVESGDNLKIWVGNLPLNVDDATLRALFEPFGLVTVAQVKVDSYGDRCFGFVHFTDEECVRKAVDTMNGTMVQDRRITVRRKRSDEKRKRARLEDEYPDCKIFIANIPSHIDNITLQREFENFGEVISARIITDKMTHLSKGFGFVVMGNPRQMAVAVANMNGFSGFDPAGRPLLVRPADQRQRDAGGTDGEFIADRGSFNTQMPKYNTRFAPMQSHLPQSYMDHQQYYPQVMQANYGQYNEVQGAPPLPSEDFPPPPPLPDDMYMEQPPLPPDDELPPPPPAPPSDTAIDVQSEYEKFLAEMGG